MGYLGGAVHHNSADIHKGSTEDNLSPDIDNIDIVADCGYKNRRGNSSPGYNRAFAGHKTRRASHKKEIGHSRLSRCPIELQLIA